VISSADEARLIARTEFQIKQFDFSGARLLLEYALEKRSARAAFMMTETYDWRMLRCMASVGMPKRPGTFQAGRSGRHRESAGTALKSSSLPPDRCRLEEEGAT
jgi:hypothetical protein